LKIVKKKTKTYGAVAYWVTTRDEDTGKLVASKRFPDQQGALAYQLEQSEAANPPGRVLEVKIEVLPFGNDPPDFKKP
jgi:hypothetical protein